MVSKNAGVGSSGSSPYDDNISVIIGSLVCEPTQTRGKKEQ